MKTDIEIVNLFEKKLTNTPIENITVNEICNDLNIKRQTFYYYFKDIYEVCENYLNNSKNEILTGKSDFQTNLFDYLDNHIAILSKIANSNLVYCLEVFIEGLLINYIIEKISSNNLSKELSYSNFVEIANNISCYTSRYLVSTLESEFNFDKKVVSRKFNILTSDEIIKTFIDLYVKNRAVI